MICSIVILGFREENGSWKTICIERRALFSSWRFRPRRFLRSKSTSPAVGSTNSMTHFPRVVFPQPDSPTRPSVSLDFTLRFTPSTARTQPTVLARRPSVIGKCFCRQVTVSNASSMSLFSTIGCIASRTQRGQAQFPPVPVFVRRICSWHRDIEDETCTRWEAWLDPEQIL